jgi:hypothetical protein
MTCPHAGIDSGGAKAAADLRVIEILSKGQLKFHFKFVYKESLKDYLTTRKSIDQCIENLNCIPSISDAPFEK